MEDSLNDLTRSIIGAAIEVHRELGPGLLESVYEICLATELRNTGHKVIRQKKYPLRYKGMDLGQAFRADLLVDGRVIVEVKAVESLQSIHSAQLLSYLRLSRCRTGLLFNFHELQLKDGIKRLLNGY